MAEGNELQRWADKAMFQSEAMPFNVNETGPRVHLIGMTADPLGHIAAAAKMYKGEVVRSLSDVTFAERGSYLREIMATKLKAPFEFVKFHFMIEGVTRSFTHQMVRQRTAAYAQESLRFAVKENLDEEVLLPPSLAGLPADHPQRVLWRQGLNRLDDVYNALIADGVPAEDARGLLPHNVTTRLHYTTDLRALQDHAGNRLCTQAQFEWRSVFVRIVDAIRNYKPHAAIIKSTTTNLPKDVLDAMAFLDSNESWQYEAIADLFRPVCYLTGKCEFQAEFDRPCSIRSRVQANHDIGRPSKDWDTEHDTVDPLTIVAGVGPQSVIREEFAEGNIHRPVFIGAIQPHEWLTDPGAAR